MKCVIKGCKGKRVYATGYCNKHQWRWKKYGDPNITTRPRYDGSVVCVADGCTKPAYSKGMCRSHWRLMKLYGDLNPRKVKRNDGYRLIRTEGKRKGEHVLIAERAIGHELPDGAIVHHVNERRDDNRNSNLVVCPDTGYHYLLHRRAKALDECGNANWLKCGYCKQYDAPENIVTINATKQGVWYHRDCRNAYRRERIKKGLVP